MDSFPTDKDLHMTMRHLERMCSMPYAYLAWYFLTARDWKAVRSELVQSLLKESEN